MKNTDFCKLSKAERDKMTSIISEVLRKDNEVVFAYLYGSFIMDDSFKDIDIFVYISGRGNPFACAVRLKESILNAAIHAGIEKFAVDDFDVRIINDSPYDFAIDLLSEGRLIVDKDPELRTSYIEDISDEYRVNYFILDEVYGEGR
ncbi:MAG: hypothetical protein A3G39_07320 [Deltaproteobacteria bacterium RIFCSPLOWO2_12_FULL_43_16]|nr:MAG: hypothetical protein A2Z89_07695 [Deltaproteobacteria bacterium GWA2_43_19]OGQ12808.1 MAG: hypothetical protein A3D30_01240 [Deltaproteobacteria bacterium RIFCSPHIGHO2_02_FULL_43_33]OGQ57075.1 MAG: hypothetical protein A3G39_07320 [Deltaproteobacteria bacterium RIFCSPLOWO2_12_FULL_43_16]HBR16894.1 hypothetical protein [Deltaproteobacteria bacterium]